MYTLSTVSVSIKYLVSYCIASLVSVGRLVGHLLWLTGKCDQLNWSSILLDGYKKRRLPGRDTAKGYKYRFLFILFLTACFTSVLVL